VFGLVATLPERTDLLHCPLPPNGSLNADAIEPAWNGYLSSRRPRLRRRVWAPVSPPGPTPLGVAQLRRTLAASIDSPAPPTWVPSNDATQTGDTRSRDRSRLGGLTL
jgi:hypothetical protein